MKNFGLLSLLAVSVLYADSEESSLGEVRSADNKKSVLFSDNQTAYDEKEDVRPSANDTYGVVASGSFLYWVTKVDGLNYKLTGAQNIHGFGPESQGATFGPNFKWDAGYRLALGYENQPWDIYLAYTRYKTSASAGQPFADTSWGSDNPSWAVFSPLAGAPTAFEAANANWNFSYWTIELMSGIFLKANENFKVCPNLGFMSAMLNQNYAVQYFFHGSTEFDNYIMTNDFRGNGLKALVNMIWTVNEYFGFHGKSGWALLFGNIDVSMLAETTNEFRVSDPAHPGFSGKLGGTYLNVKNRMHTAKSQLEISAGVDFAYPVEFYSHQRAHRVKFLLDLDWVLNYWPGQNQIMRFVGADAANDNPAKRGQYLSQNGDLLIQGFILTVGLEF